MHLSICALNSYLAISILLQLPHITSYHLCPRGGGGGGGNAQPVCTAGAFLILCLTTKVATGVRDNCPFTFPPPTLPPPPWQSSPFTSRSVPPPNQLRQLKLPAWGRGYDQFKQSTHYLHHKNRVDFPQYIPSFTIPSALIH